MKQIQFEETDRKPRLGKGRSQHKWALAVTKFETHLSQEKIRRGQGRQAIGKVECLCFSFQQTALNIQQKLGDQFTLLFLFLMYRLTGAVNIT